MSWVTSSEETERISDSKGLLGRCRSKSSQLSMDDEASAGDTGAGDTARTSIYKRLVLRWYGPKLAESSGSSD